MKNLLLYIALGSTTLLAAASISNTNEDIHQKRDNIHQRTQSQVQHRQPQKQMKQRETHRIEKQRTMKMQEQSKRKNQYQEQYRQPKRLIDKRDAPRFEAQKKMQLQEQSKRKKQYQEQHRQISKPVYQKELQRKHIKSGYYTPKERERRITKRIKQRDSIKRTFRTHKDFIRARPHLRSNYYHRYYKRDYIRRPHIRQVGILYFINNWYFIYRDRHAPFYDQFGYFYGFFNQFGFFFEGIFYAYDRYYTYEDRLRGRGLFDNRYYEPYLEDRYNDWYDIYEDPYYYDEDPYYN